MTPRIPGRDWLAARKRELGQRWQTLQSQLLPPDWPARCACMKTIPDGSYGSWQPRAGSSSAELALLIARLPLSERQWLACLLDAPRAGRHVLVEAVERLQLDWVSKVDPLHSHREYAAQLVILARLLGLPAAAETAYMENEARIAPAVDRLLFESLSSEERSHMAARNPPGTGAYLTWWHRQLIDRASDSGQAVTAPERSEWPDLPPAWLALGWLCTLRTGAPAGPP